jgi:hypothetical protein
LSVAHGRYTVYDTILMDIPGYEIIEQVGEGAMATVWKARQLSLERVVALKVLHPDHAVTSEDVEAFIHEARTVAKLKNPNIVQIHDIGEHEGTCYFVMEFVEGETLAQKLERGGPLPLKESLSIARRVATALDGAWKTARVVHRDIKPANIIIGADGIVKVADLGLAKSVDAVRLSSQLHSGVIEGTPNYISPEQASCKENVDCRSDIYSLGATLYHMVTGQMPFSDLSALEAIESHVGGTLPHPRDVNLGVTVGVGQLITRMMMKNPDDRYENWPETIDAIKKTAGGRMLIGQKAGPPSTILPAAKSAPRSGAQRSRGRKQQREQFPAPVRLLGWAFVLACCATVVYFTLPGLRDRTAAPPEPPPPAPPPAVPAPAPDPVAAPQPVEQPPTPPPEPPPARGIGPVLEEVARYLAREDFLRAGGVIERELEQARPAEERTELAALSTLVSHISRMYTVIEARFRTRLGQPIALHQGGEDRRMVISKIEDGTLHATMITADGAKNITFTVKQIDPLELIKWVGDDDTPALNAMKFILSVKGGDKARAATYATASGPLAGAFGSILAGAP